MAYGDLTKTPFSPSTTKTIDTTKTTDIDTDTNNPIEQVNLNASAGVWMYEETLKEYVGKYHIHQDGTVMSGVGILEESHNIDSSKILIKQTVSKAEGFDPPTDDDDTTLLSNIPDEPTVLEVREIVADIFYKKFFENNVLTNEQILAVQTTIRGGFERTGRTEDEQLVFYKKDRNTIENKEDLQGESFNSIVNYIYTNELLTDILEDSFSLEIYDYDGDIPEEVLLMVDVISPKLRNYDIKYQPTDDLFFTITIATEVLRYIEQEGYLPLINPYFTDALNLSQIVKPKIGTKIDPDKAREILDTTIFELLPTQTTRQDQINEFFNDFNNLIGQAPPLVDVDDDGAGEYINPAAKALDRQGRVSYENKSTAYITRLNTHANTNNQGKTLESMRNQLNSYLGDVDNVVQVIPDQRPEYENKSSGFLKIRKPNQAIILRAPGAGELEFQKEVTINGVTGPSFLMEGFTTTMWVRFVSKIGKGTLFNFGNPLSSVNPYGFRLETITNNPEDSGNNKYNRFFRLIVRGQDDNLYDNHWGTLNHLRQNTTETGNVGKPDGHQWAHTVYPTVSTDDLNEWFFICATYNPIIDEVQSFELAEIITDENGENYLLKDKHYWLNHRDPSSGILLSSSNFGAKCKVEVISRSDLLRARGFKVGSLESNVEGEDVSVTGETQTTTTEILGG